MTGYSDFVRSFDRRVAIVAHRGAWHHAPENSIAALETAVALECEIMETDVQSSCDEVLFNFHDPTLDRMVGDPRPVKNLEISDLQSLRLRNRNGGANEPRTNNKIPALDMMLESAKGRIFLDLDVKYPWHLNKTCGCVLRHGMQNQVNVKTKLRNASELAEILALKAGYGLMVMPQIRFCSEDADSLFALMTEIEPVMVEAKFDDLQTLASRADMFADSGVSIWVNTLDDVACSGLSDTKAKQNPDAVWGELIRAGVSIIQTDEPEELALYLKQSGQNSATING